MDKNYGLFEEHKPPQLEYPLHKYFWQSSFLSNIPWNQRHLSY